MRSTATPRGSWGASEICRHWGSASSNPNQVSGAMGSRCPQQPGAQSRSSVWMAYTLRAITCCHSGCTLAGNWIKSQAGTPNQGWPRLDAAFPSSGLTAVPRIHTQETCFYLGRWLKWSLQHEQTAGLVFLYTYLNESHIMKWKTNI